ncbi:MAG: hypothetical protein GKR90_15280 [Pseudomonadales bacterium]|nr:hypothetical protein [Pseudomonadales bacterium]
MSETLVHNPKNAVTERIERRVVDGQTVVVKAFSCKNREDTPVEWRASTEPRHWNYWAREANVYESRLNDHMVGTGVRLPTMISLVRSQETIELTMEDVIGRTGSDLTLQDCGLIAKAWGHAQGQLLTTIGHCQSGPASGSCVTMRSRNLPITSY